MYASRSYNFIFVRLVISWWLILVSVGTSKLGPIGAQMISSIQINFKKRNPKQQEILLRNSEAGKKVPIVGS